MDVGGGGGVDDGWRVGLAAGDLCALVLEYTPILTHFLKRKPTWNSAVLTELGSRKFKHTKH